ncbi:hypothetical protein [Chitinimonas lacunae]|uniref:Uncharacterized protein n=1 Tax=Chitinimonas lacunae TaxID=1963018 RepID=A0ABV8MK80_9NEIS
MKLVSHAIDPVLLSRLSRQGLPYEEFDPARPPATDVPRWWLWSAPFPPPLAPGDLWIDTCIRPFDQDITTLLPGVPVLSLVWQHSSFAAEHGFLLTVGGQTDTVLTARPLLDALAPLPGGWLHAGDTTAPRFLAAVAGRVGGSLQQLATLVMQSGATSLLPLLDLHRTLLLDLAQLSQSYLACPSQPYRPALPLPPLFAPLGPEISDDDSPARRVAKTIVWLVLQQQTQP